MKRRQGITALLTLIALVVSFSGTAFASACAVPAPAASHAQHEGMPGNPAQDHDSEQPMPGCPMSVAGCATAPSMATNVSIALVDAPEVVLAAVATHDALDHVRTSIIFHPPRF